MSRDHGPIPQEYLETPPGGVTTRGYYVVYNGGPDEAFVCHWPSEWRDVCHELSDVESGPYWCKSDAEKALAWANEITSRWIHMSDHDRAYVVSKYKEDERLLPGHGGVSYDPALTPDLDSDDYRVGG